MGELKQFGDYAVELGHCTRGQVDRALEIQKDLVDRGYAKTLIGLIMVRYGMIDTGQLIDILKVLEKNHASLIAD